MKIIEEFVLDKWVREERCVNCHSLLEIDAEDIKSRREEKGGVRMYHFYFTCPVCHGYRSYETGEGILPAMVRLHAREELEARDPAQITEEELRKQERTRVHDEMRNPYLSVAPSFSR